jgi:transposase
MSTTNCVNYVTEWKIRFQSGIIAGMENKYLIVPRTGELTARGLAFWTDALRHAADGATHRQIAERTGVSVDSINRMKQRFPDFRNQLEQAMYDASVLDVEQLKEIPLNAAADPARARVQIEALSRYLELRWPNRYGKRVNMNVKTVDLTEAIKRARQRQAQVIDSTAETVDVSTDSVSVDEDDMFG